LADADSVPTEEQLVTLTTFNAGAGAIE